MRISTHEQNILMPKPTADRRGCDRMVVGSITTFAIIAYYHQRCEFEPHKARCTRYNNM